ncbi:MAG TPA: regulatory protein RecX [Chitinophagaceae bacterium]|nr:regulatory protein RecX [Chitinophagaceae bacterium]
MFYPSSLTNEQALQKLRHFCGYQERCHFEVREKLYKLGVKKSEQDALIATLIEENYLNEERFAIAFASGKFRINEWGRIKIKHELRQRQVSDYCINKALKQIPAAEYKLLLLKLAKEKYNSLKKETGIMRKKKTMDFLAGRGFEGELVMGVLAEPAFNDRS